MLSWGSSEIDEKNHRRNAGVDKEVAESGLIGGGWIRILIFEVIFINIGVRISINQNLTLLKRLNLLIILRITTQ